MASPLTLEDLCAYIAGPRAGDYEATRRWHDDIAMRLQRLDDHNGALVIILMLLLIFITASCAGICAAHEKLDKLAAARRGKEVGP